MMSSLRGRQLISSFVIFFIGILALGMWLSLTIYQRETDAIAEELERTALELLSYIEYDDGSFLITEANRPESDAFLNEQGLRQNGKERFAYLWDASQQKVTWDSLDNNDVDQQEVKNNFALFDFDAIMQEVNAQSQGFSPAEARQVYSAPQATEEKPVRYMVAAQKFAMNSDSGKSDYLFIVATSMADVETGIDAAIKAFMPLFFIAAVLLLLAQLVFSLWVLAPLRHKDK